MKRYMAVSAILLLAATSFAMGTRESVANAPRGPLEMKVAALKGPTGIGMIKLFEEPPILPEAVTASFEAVGSADAIAAKLLSGEVDAAVLPINMAAKLYNAGLPYRMTALVGNGMVKILTADPSVRSIADLRGREVFVAGQGATPEFLMRTILAKAGMVPDKDIRLNFSMPYPEMAASLVSGRIAIAVLPEPFATVAIKGNPALIQPFALTALWKNATGNDDYPMTAFVVRSSLIVQRPAAIKALLAAYKQAIAWAITNPAAAGLLVEKFDLGLKAPIAAAAIPASNYVFLSAPASRAAVESLLSVFLAAAPASIGGKLPDGDFYADAGL